MQRTADEDEFEAVEERLRTLLPQAYSDRYDDVQPVSMGSAGLKFGLDGRVAWDQMWGSFCDLAMAGGPPHKGTLLEPASVAEIAAQPARYEQVVQEICRGVRMVTGLEVEPSPAAGWVRVSCGNHTMAAWLLRAIAMENISVASAESATIDLPAGPAYRLEKEIKNVITVIAKTCHYWQGHMPATQRRAIGDLLERMAIASPLLTPEIHGATRQHAPHEQLRNAIQLATGLDASKNNSAGWLGVDCRDVHAAVWMMRMLVASNVLSRREGTAVFVPVCRDEASLIRRFIRVHRFATERGILTP